MARSTSRTRGRPSKSPARTKKATPKSEPKKAASRSRSASRGRPAAPKTPKTEPKKVAKKVTPKSEKKTPSRSRSRSRATTTTTTSKAKTPAKSPSKSPARTPATAVKKTPAVPLRKTPLPQAASTPYQRPSRSDRREAAGVASAKILRPESYSPARLQVRSPSRQRPLLTRWKTNVVAQAKAGCKYFQKHRNDILISIGLILFISFIGFMIFKEDNPVKKFAAAKAQWAQKQAQQAYVKAIEYWNNKA